MPYAVMSGSKVIGTTKKKSKKNIDSILAKEYRRKNPVRISHLRKVRKK